MQTDASPDLTKLLQTSTAIFSLLGIGLYGAVRFGQQVFYDELHVTPEEVGLTYASTLSRAAVVIAALISVTVIALRLLTTVRDPFPEERNGLNIAVGCLSALGTFAALVFLFFLTLGLTGVLVAIFGMFFLVVLTQRVSLKDQATALAGYVRRPVGALVAISFITVVAFAVSGLIALSSASAVKAGEELFGNGAHGMLGLRAESVKLSGDLTSTYTPPANISLLGRADGMIILYDYDRDQPLRVPANGVIVLHS